MPKPAHPMALARTKWARHKAQSKFRNIGFHFTFDEWYEWWLQHGVDKNLHANTFDKSDTNRLCMCRIGDQGDYEPNNVYCATTVKNCRDTKHHDIKKSYKPIYKWGEELVDITTLRDLIQEHKGVTHFQSHHYKIDDYDSWRHKEARRLTNRLREIHGTLKKRTQYYCNKDGKWYDTMVAVCKAQGVYKDTYKKRLALGHEGYATRVEPTLEDYIKKHTMFPDPIIPQDR